MGKKYNTQKQDQYLQKTYGISLEEKLQRLKLNSDRCEICKKKVKILKDKEWLRVSVVDHCHTTGKIRGILCSQCNAALGLLQEKPEVLFAAYEYLVFHQPPRFNNEYHQLTLPFQDGSLDWKV